MMASRLIGKEGIRRTASGFELEIRLPWYRGLPLSTFRELELSVAGKAIEPTAIKLRVNGVDHELGSLPSKHDEIWFVLDSGVLVVEGEAPAPGACEVDLRLALEIPYIKSRRMSTRGVKTVAVH